MSTAPHHDPISIADYLCGEQDAERRHEYVEGVVYAMVGATNAHNRIATNGTVALGSQLRGKTCQVFNSDTKVRVRAASGTRFYYPDISVVCSANPATDTFQDAPVVLVEVISESTRRTDENEKREAYFLIASMRAYVLVEQSSAAVVVHRRANDGMTREIYSGDHAAIPLPEIECELVLADLFENVEFTPIVSDDDEYG